MPAKPIKYAFSALPVCVLPVCVLLGMSAAPGVTAASPPSVKNSAPPAKAFVPPAKAPLPTVLLYPASSGDIAALVDLRTRLRLDDEVEVLTYDPESAAIQRASSENAHPEWLVSAPATDSGRMVLARALGASFYAVVSPGRAADTTHVELVETAPAARTFDWTGTNRQFGVRAMESQVADSVSHPVTYATAGDLTASIPTPPAAAPVPPPAAPNPAPAAAPLPLVAAAVPAPTPAIAPPVVAAVPIPAAPAPIPIVAVPVAPAPTAVAAVPPPVAAPMKIAVPMAVRPVPMAVRPVPAAPLPLDNAVPLVKTTPLPLPMPVAQAVPISPPVAPPLPKVAAVPAPIAVPTPVVMPAPALVLPKVAAPLPKVADVPAPPLTIALPAPRLDPLPTPVLPAPTLPQVAAVPPPRIVTAHAPLAQIATPPVEPLMPPVQVATLPKREIPVPRSALTPPFLPEAAPPPARPAPAALPTIKKPSAKAENMAAIEPLLAKGDAALDGGDAVSAIALYRQAINGAPLSVVPRLKLAQAYQKDGLNDRALDEARRALEIAPDSAPVQQFLSNLDQQTGTTAGALVRDQAALSRDPSSPAAHAALADTLWNNGDLSDAEAEYKAAAALAPPGSHEAQAQLAQLYAAEARYDDCLAILKTGGKDSYAVAIQIVKNRTDTLSSTLDSSRETFAAGKSTREQFYDDAKKLSAEAQALAEFVADVTPPAAYKLSHLHRKLSTNLLAQEAAALVSFIETGDKQQTDTIARLEHAAATEMLTAQATEEKLGLWKQKPQIRESATE